LEQVQTSRRRRDPSYVNPELALPELPAAVAHLWRWYVDEIQTGERLTWQEIRSWSILTNKEISEVEAKAIRNLSFIHHRTITQTQ
jgi:hypothetical protein